MSRHDGSVEPTASPTAIAEPLVILVVHPDDETLALSCNLPLFERLTPIHSSDGESGGDHAIREAELELALSALGCRPARRVCLRLPDGEIGTRLAELIAMLRPLLADRAALVTRAFEGGHADHDSCAVAALRARAGSAPPIIALEFPIYSLAFGNLVTTRFDRVQTNATRFFLDEGEKNRKQAALAAFKSQAHVVDRFPLDMEELRPSRSLDVTKKRDVATLLFYSRDIDKEAVWPTTLSLVVLERQIMRSKEAVLSTGSWFETEFSAPSYKRPFFG